MSLTSNVPESQTTQRSSGSLQKYWPTSSSPAGGCGGCGPATCERCGLGHGAVLGLCGDDAGSGTEHRRGQQGQLFNDAADARVVLGKLAEALLQGITQEVQLLTGFVKTSLGLKIEKERNEVPGKIPNAEAAPVNSIHL